MQLGILLLLAALPILELALLIKFGQIFGFWATLALITFTGIAGTLVIQSQGLAMMERLRVMVTSRRASPDVDFEGLLTMLAGVLLVLPGPISDTLGLLLLVPPVRNAAGRWIRRHVQVFTVSPAPSASEPPPGGPIIEGEFERLDERRPEPGGTDSKRRSG